MNTTSRTPGHRSLSACLAALLLTGMTAGLPASASTRVPDPGPAVSVPGHDVGEYIAQLKEKRAQDQVDRARELRANFDAAAPMG